MSVRRFLHAGAIIAAMVFPFAVHGSDGETITASPDGADLLVYTNGSIVRDHRTVRLPKTEARVSIAQIPRRISQDSTVIDGEGLTVGGKIFRLNTISRPAVLSRYVGKEITVARTNPATGKETRETAILLSAGHQGSSNDSLFAGNNALILKYKDRTEVGLEGRIILPGIPADFTTEPTLLADITAKRRGKTSFDLVYATNGIRWSGDYIAVINDKTLSLNAQATVHNTLDHTFDLNRLDIIAGQVPFQTTVRRLARIEAAAAEALPRSRFDEFHRYSITGPMRLHANQVRQWSLFRAGAVPYERLYVHRSRTRYATLGRTPDVTKANAAIEIHFANDKASGLGLPMPAGTVRFYKKDKQGLNFTGAAQIGDTTPNQRLELPLGQAFDIVIERRRVDFSKQPGPGATAAWEIRIANSKANAARVIIEEQFDGDWEIIDESSRHKKISAGTVEWAVAVPANSERTLSFRVRMQGPEPRPSPRPLSRVPANTSN